MAKEIVGSQRAVSKLYASKAQINSVIMQMESQASMVRMSKGIQASTDVMKLMNKLTKVIEYKIIGEGSQICRYCLRRKGHKSQLLAGEGSQILLF